MRNVLGKLQLSANSAVPDHIQIGQKIEELIRTGELKEGEKLPSTTELVNLWGLNITRIQRAMETLVASGLLQRFPRRGTFVMPQSIRPSIGILVSPDLLPETSQFDRVITSALRNEVRDHGLNPRIYDAMSIPESDEGQRSRVDIEYDLRHHKFNGFVLLDGQKPENVPAIKSKDMPCVMFGLPKPPIDVHFDYYHFSSTAAAWLIERGCRKIAYFYNSLEVVDYDDDIRGFKETLAGAGLRIFNDSMIDIANLMSMTSPLPGPLARDRNAYGGMLELLKRWRRRGFFPDGIIISEDIVARGMAVAIQMAIGGEPVPPHMIVLATEGAEHFYALPAARYSYSAVQIAQALIQRLIAKATKERVLEAPTLVKGRIIEAYR